MADKEKQTGRSAAGARSEDISRKIADKIRSMIAQGTIAAGVRLGQAELAEACSASRVPVREALKLLAAEGHVVHDQNRGFCVALLSSSEARQLYHLRAIVEADLLSKVHWPDADQLADLRAQVDRIERFNAEGQITEWMKAHRAFRESVFGLSSEDFLVKEALRLWSIADRYRSLLAATPHPSIRPEGSTDRHLLEALAERDRSRLLSVFQEDRSRIAETLFNILRQRGL